MTLPTHDGYAYAKDREKATSYLAHFWTGDEAKPTSEPGTVLIGADPDYGGIAFHIGETITFTVDESDLLEAISKEIRT